MKRNCLLVAMLVLMASASLSWAALNGLIAHEKYIYPVVRVTDGSTSGGSGTIIYSKNGSTYVLTNHHVVDSAIKIEEQWDRDLQKNVKREKLKIMYVEIFKYRNISLPVGTLKVEAEIIAYNKDEDMALLKLRSEETIKYIAELYPRDKLDEIYVMEETVAVGCSLLLPPLPTTGVITRQNYLIDSYQYGMSSAQIIYGNSGGAMFLADGKFIGIPSRGAAIGWGTPITHMGFFIPLSRVYDWLEKEHFDFIWDGTKTEQDCTAERKSEIDKKIASEKK